MSGIDSCLTRYTLPTLSPAATLPCMAFGAVTTLLAPTPHVPNCSQMALMEARGVKRKEPEVNKEPEVDEDERCARFSLKKWVVTHNTVATTLISLAMSCPEKFTAVEDYENKLYTAITNVAWVNEEKKTACWLSMRTASRLVAFIKSMLGEKKRMDLDEGPYGIANTGEDIKKEDENDMHCILRELGFDKLEIRIDDSFMKEMHAKYACIRDDFEPDEDVFERESIFWENAILAWGGEAA